MPDSQLLASRRLRQEGTRAEAVLWEHLRDRQLEGAKFRRQAVIGRFIVDFYCHEHRLVVELDGAVHDQPDIAAHDSERQQHLEVQGYRVLRFNNRAVFTDIDGVLKIISTAFNAA